MYQDQTNQLACLPYTICSSDKEYQSAPTKFADPLCICRLGYTYQDLPVYNSSLPCSNVTRCIGTTYYDATLTTDNICAVLDIVFDASFDLVASPNASASFKSALTSAVLAIPGIYQPLFLEIVLSPGSIIATLESSNQTALDIIRIAIEDGLLHFTWFDMFFNGTTNGGCAPGSNPDVNGQCKPCPQNTYSYAGLCLACPKGSFSNPGSTICAAGSTGGAKAGTATIITAVIVGCACIVSALVFLHVYNKKRRVPIQYTLKNKTIVASEFSNPLYDSNFPRNEPARRTVHDYHEPAYEPMPQPGVVANPAYDRLPNTGGDATAGKPGVISNSAYSTIPHHPGYAEPQYMATKSDEYLDVDI